LTLHRSQAPMYAYGRSVLATGHWRAIEARVLLCGTWGTSLMRKRPPP